ncbi:MAG: NACHT domain-containing protein [Timaviella obliquedivisa GSE-PSE-MK23-08B]|jgi:DNA polymerase III delta prime subunit/MFS family permease|nr:NACHT domain-containing protein [Timaviella obliquedivisa GSE-PSE-MK23-08B]
MTDPLQGQGIESTELKDSNLQQSQAGGDVNALNNSPHAQLTIQRSFISLFGQSREQPGIDWERAGRILQQQQPEIKSRLKQMLFGDVLLDVDLAEEPELVAKLRSQSTALEAQKILTIDGVHEEAIDSRQPILATYAREDIRGKLLILGTPGAGKTTTLLKLAEQLVGEAIAQPKTVIPIIFELSTWRDDSQSIEAWLLAQLYENFGGDRKRKIYEPWLEKQVLLPLLDGLDELGLVRQKLCTEKINEFARTYPQLVVCCRVREFMQAGVKLSNLRGAVCLQPLSDGQIQEYLGQVGKLELWQQIQAVPEMARLLKPVLPAVSQEDEDNSEDEEEPGLLRVPLFIGLAARVYDSQKPLQGKADLFERYIDRQLSPEVRESDRLRKEFTNRDWAYKTLAREPDWRDVRRSLGWLAGQLQERNQVELLIEKMQPSWLDEGRSRWGYRVSVGLIFGLTGLLIGGLTVGLLGLLIGGLIGGLLGSLTVGLIFGLTVGLIGRLDDIKPVENFRISMSQKVRREILRSLRGWLIFGLIFGLILSLIVLIVGLIYGLIFGLTVGLISGLLNGMKQDLKTRSRPNQGIWKSLYNVAWVTTFSYPLAVMWMAGTITLPVEALKAGMARQSLLVTAEVVQKSLLQAIIPGIAGALIFGLFGGGLACIQHLSLRFTLTHDRKIPWNYARFLNYCVERRLLQRIGGRYRFIHRELLDHFAFSKNYPL